MDIELKILRFISTNLPPIRGMGLIPIKLLVPFYNRIHRDKVIANFKGKIMELDPTECIDRALLFYPQLVDRKELEFLEKHLKTDSIFVDIGANVGMYSLVAANHIRTGKIIAIEADHFNFQRLLKNIFLNSIQNIVAINKGVSDKSEILKLYLNERGNRSGNSFLDVEPGLRQTISVECETLSTVLKECNIQNIDIMKIDIEGFEYKVLNNFFLEAFVDLYPTYIITEYHEGLKDLAGGSVIDLLINVGYKIIYKEDINYILEFS